MRNTAAEKLSSRAMSNLMPSSTCFDFPGSTNWFWLVVLMAVLVILQVYVLQFKWWLAVAYSIPAIIFPLIVILVRLRKSVSTQDFHQLSTITKLVMFTGILSMFFFYYYL